MPAAVNDFNIGKNCTVVINHPLAPSGRLDLSIVTDFMAKSNTKDITVDGLDGINRTRFLPQHWDISIGIDRASAALDDFVAALDNAYFTSGSVPAGTVYQYVTEMDGSQSTYQFDDVVFKADGSGDWKGDGAVKQKLEGRCSRRRRV